MEQVFFKQLDSYEPEPMRCALREILLPAAEPYGGFAGKKVMIKPNFLEYRRPDDPACVHPVMLVELCRLLREQQAAAVAVIENPAVRTAPAIVEAMEIKNELDLLGVTVANCGSYEKLTMPPDSCFHQLEIATEFQDYDLIIDFAKAKTHAMMTLTLAVKNLFGLIRGSERLGWHLAVGRDYDKFADLLLDIYRAVKPQISLLDAVTGMEGNGPGSGTPVQLNFIAAATDALALDDAVAKQLGTPDIPVLTRARSRNLLAGYDVYGEIPVPRTIKLPSPPKPSLSWGVYFPVKLREFLRRKMVSQPVVNKKLCIGCGLCAAKCPPQSLIMKRGRPVFHYHNCIHCYCCQEYCPKGAITSAKSPLMRFADALEKLLRR